MQAQAFKRTNSRGQTYYLHGQTVTLKGNRQQQIYYFAKTIRDDRAIATLPVDYEVVESPRTALPLLKKIKKEA